MSQKTTEEEYDIEIIKLANACPLHLENSYCPLKGVRRRELNGKAGWLNSLSLPTKKTIYSYHLLCYSKNYKPQKKAWKTHPANRGYIVEKGNSFKRAIIIMDEYRRKTPNCKAQH